MIIIDAHSHLWLKQDTTVDGQRIYQTDRGRSMFFGEERQMLPPFMIDGKNSAEVFLANMDYAQVSGAVVVQEIIDGQQNDYLKEVLLKYPSRFKVCGMPRLEPMPSNQDFAYRLLVDIKSLNADGFNMIAIPGHRVHTPLTEMMESFKYMESNGILLSMCLDDNELQIGQMREVIQECPDLKVAIGHFGMVTGQHFMEQIMLASAGKNVRIESGGITWLFNSEFYPFNGAVKAIRQAADAVGMDRLMWGSDYPRTICAITYKMSYDFVLKTNELTDNEKAQFLGLNAVSFYGFDSSSFPELPYIKNMSE